MKRLRNGKSALGLSASLLVLALAGCASAVSECAIHPVADLHPHSPDGVPLVSATVAGKPSIFVVDTGATDSVLTTRFVQAAGLTSQFTGSSVSGIGGTNISRLVIAATLTIGSATGRDVIFDEIPYLAIHRPNGLPVDGLFGGDFLSNYDVDLDLGAERIGIYWTAHCDGGDFHPLGRNAFSVPMDRPLPTRASVEVHVDGQPLTFLLDSGASTTFLSARSASLLGVTPAMLATDPLTFTEGVGASQVPTRSHRFKLLRLGPERVEDPVLAVYDGQVNILGGDFLRRNRVWISYAVHRLFVQPRPSVLAAAP